LTASNGAHFERLESLRAYFIGDRRIFFGAARPQRALDRRVER
jgi:hypothetical protein